MKQLLTGRELPLLKKNPLKPAGPPLRSGATSSTSQPESPVIRGSIKPAAVNCVKPSGNRAAPPMQELSFVEKSLHEMFGSSPGSPQRFTDSPCAGRAVYYCLFPRCEPEGTASLSARGPLLLYVVIPGAQGGKQCPIWDGFEGAGLAGLWPGIT